MLHRCDKPFFLNAPVGWQRIGWMIVFLSFVSVASVCSQEKMSPDAMPGIFNFYQEYISPVDGDRCPMVPSCSRYMKDAVKKHGAVIGIVMGLDRLVRCGRDERNVSSPVWVNGKKQIYDPVENNDFWWSEK